jgi:hypothetical protein
MTSAGLNSLQEKMCSNSIWYFIILPKKTPFFKTKNKADFKCMDDWSPQWAQCPQQPQWPQQPHFTKKSLPPKWPITALWNVFRKKIFWGYNKRHVTKWDMHLLATKVLTHNIEVPGTIGLLNRHNYYISLISQNHLTHLTWLIQCFYPQNGICYQKYNFWPNIDGENWSTKDIFQIPPCRRLLSLTS